MPKATIEIEMPSKCWSCTFRKDIDFLHDIFICRLTGRNLDNGDLWDSRPSFCPLKEVKE